MRAMITTKLCNEVKSEDIFTAFKYGFSDYPVPMTLSIDEFFGRFFGPEGNDLNTSYVAYDDEKAIGVVFGGIRLFDNAKTMRCGSLCVGPEYRGKKISNMLMDLHIMRAKEEHCMQLFLEVMSHNERAIKFYESLGYFKTYTLKYYSLELTEALVEFEPKMQVEQTNFEKIEYLRNSIRDIHINWQNDIDYFRNSRDHVCLISKQDMRVVGYIAMSKTGKVEQLYVDPNFRRKGIARELLLAAARKQATKKIDICFSSNAQYEYFLRKLNFKKKDVEQFEMFMPL